MQNIRFYPLNLEARERIRCKNVGDIYTINGSYLQDWLLYENDFNWRLTPEKGGPLCAVADIGAHWIDLVTMITNLASDSVIPFISYPGGHCEGFADTFKQFFQRFYDSITGVTDSASTPFPTFEEGHRAVLLCEAILKSHREGRWIKV